MILIRSDARHLPLADESVQCCVTSPPYWGLRSYEGNPSMIGLEPTFEAHLENLVAVFREVRRVLRADGTCWLNYGDAYASNGLTGRADEGQVTFTGGASQGGPRVKKPAHGLKPKDLMMMPARVALALQADGWWLRSEIIWHKPNPMPESCTDRPTSAHEKLFLLTKSPRYFYDAEAVRVPHAREWDAATNNKGVHEKTAKYQAIGHCDSPTSFRKDSRDYSGANLRNVWTIPTQGVSDAHFATFPERLVEPCILAGTSAEGACAKCGAPWARVQHVEGRRGVDFISHQSRLHHGRSTAASSPNIKRETTGWKPTCECEAPTVPCTVLDPFVGSGTVCRVATRLNRRAVGCDLGYQEIAAKRATNVQRMLL